MRLSKKILASRGMGADGKKGLIKTIRKKRKAPRGCCRAGLELEFKPSSWEMGCGWNCEKR